jgi:hypothetical protein
MITSGKGARTYAFGWGARTYASLPSVTVAVRLSPPRV